MSPFSQHYVRLLKPVYGHTKTASFKFIQVPVLSNPKYTAPYYTRDSIHDATVKGWAYRVQDRNEGRLCPSKHDSKLL